MALIEPLKILLILFLFLPKSAISYEFFSIGDEQMFFIRDICKFYGSKSAIFLYDKSISEMEVTTIMFKWRRAFSWEGTVTGNLYFSQLYKSSYYFKQIIRPYYIAVISNYNAINEFSLATSTFDMSSAVWIVVFIYKEHGPDYCHNPPGNIFHLRFNSEMLVLCGTESILREWYSIDTNHIEIMDVASWSLEKGITKMVPDFIYERRNNLKGLIMKAVTIKDSPFVNARKSGDIDGMFGEVLREICITLNFSLNIILEVEEYGRWNPKKKIWTGAIAELYAGHVDIALSGFSITNARLNVVDFTHPVFKTKNFLVIREPEKFRIKWSSYFLAFNHSVWFAMFGLLIGTSIFLIFLKMKNGTDRKIGYLFFDNFLEIWGIFCQQGLVDFSHRSSLRIAYFSIFLWVTVLWAVYSAALISFLTSVVHVLPFDSFERFVTDGTYQLAVVRGSAFYDKFANSGDPFAKEVMKLMLEDENLPDTAVEILKKICKNRKLAMYTYDDIRKRVNDKILCKVILIDTGHVSNFALTLSKDSPFTDVINFQLQKFIGNGMMSRLKDTSFEMKSNDMINHQPISLISVISLIFFLSIGIVLSFCILIIEKCIFIHKRKKISIVHHIPLIKLSKSKKAISDITIDYAYR